METYKPLVLSWCKTYEQEVEELRELIAGQPVDVKLLKREYLRLTGKNYIQGGNE